MCTDYQDDKGNVYSIAYFHLPETNYRTAFATACGNQRFKNDSLPLRIGIISEARNNAWHDLDLYAKKHNWKRFPDTPKPEQIKLKL